MKRNIADTVGFIGSDEVYIERKYIVMLVYIRANSQSRRNLRFWANRHDISFHAENDGIPMPIQSDMVSLPSDYRLNIPFPIWECYQINIPATRLEEISPMFTDSMGLSFSWQEMVNLHYLGKLPFFLAEHIVGTKKIPYGMGTLSRAPREMSADEKRESRKYPDVSHIGTDKRRTVKTENDVVTDIDTYKVSSTIGKKPDKAKQIVFGNVKPTIPRIGEIKLK